MPSGLEGGENGRKFSLWQPNRSVKVRPLPLQQAQFRLMSYSELPVPDSGRVFYFIGPQFLKAIVCFESHNFG
jgi:hypothetical protein